MCEKYEQEDAYDMIEDVEYADGVVKIKLTDAKVFVINRQAPNQQIWFSSPFRYFDKPAVLHALISTSSLSNGKIPTPKIFIMC